MARDLSQEPVTLAEAKKHLGVRTDFRDDEIAGLVVAARERIELYTGYALKRRVVVQTLEAFGTVAEPAVFELGPVHAVRSITYVSSNGDLVPLVGVARALGPIGHRWRLYAPGELGWPVLGHPAFIRIEYEAGYGLPLENGQGAGEPVPAALVTAMLMLVGTWFENHEGTVVGTSAVELPFGVKDICRDHRPSGVT